jgi:hypothetical protein
MNKKFNVDKFIEKVKEIHNNKYSYSMVKYKSTKDKIIILCPIHGEFNQRCENHLRGQGCPKCGRKKNLTNEEFIIKAKKKHGDKYDYSLSEYFDNKNKIKIKCDIHGVFEQTPRSHLEGDGCVKCRSPLISDFITNANIIHDNKYEYSKVIYLNSKTKIKIICPEHGEFEQKINDHLYGNGCPTCRQSKGERDISIFLKKYNINFTKQKRYPECKFKFTLPFDFLIPSLNTCIEYNGIQHYKYLKFFHKDIESFRIQQIKDKIKREYCENNNIKLLIIKYDENINEKLKEILVF